MNACTLLSLSPIPFLPSLQAMSSAGGQRPAANRMTLQSLKPHIAAPLKKKNIGFNGFYIFH
jgi:hypothetical protein